MLLSDGSRCSTDSPESGTKFLEKVKASEELWGEMIDTLLVGNSTSSLTVDWLLQELLKDKLQQWLSSKLQGQTNLSDSDCVLSRKEQGVIHMIAGLGFEWGLQPILDAGVTVNFRDINGWTALHWAARFGREKMVAALIASGASAGAVTDATKQDPIGQSPADIAAVCGHKGLAGYLSEVALTTHLSSLTLERSELAKGAAEVEAERTIGGISETGATTNEEDQLSLNDTLAAARNATEAAARIQAASKLAFRNSRDYNSAALVIQKKYRGWKGRKDFLAIRQKVVKIQAHVRGYQVRKEYRVCWATGILEKVVLRWRRRGVGLRGFHLEIDESDGEAILRVFRKQKVDAAIDEAVSRVLSMVESQEARNQYRRILEKYRQAKAKLQSAENDARTSHDSMSNMENDDLYSRNKQKIMKNYKLINGKPPPPFESDRIIGGVNIATVSPDHHKSYHRKGTGDEDEHAAGGTRGLAIDGSDRVLALLERERGELGDDVLGALDLLAFEHLKLESTAAAQSRSLIRRSLFPPLHQKLDAGQTETRRGATSSPDGDHRLPAASFAGRPPPESWRRERSEVPTAVQSRGDFRWFSQ
nr:calmodulin-binding transcription activator 4 [Ipomoea batatas]